jgi:hypothetical protein
MEKSLIGPPHFPKLQRATGSGSLRQRLIRTQVIETIYEDRRAAVPSEAMALNAVVEPMLIKERRIVIQKEIMTEFRGMSQPGRTWKMPLLADDQDQWRIRYEYLNVRRLETSRTGVHHRVQMRTFDEMPLQR